MIQRNLLDFVKKKPLPTPPPPAAEGKLVNVTHSPMSEGGLSAQRPTITDDSEKDSPRCVEERDSVSCTPSSEDLELGELLFRDGKEDADHHSETSSTNSFLDRSRSASFARLIAARYSNTEGHPHSSKRSRSVSHDAVIAAVTARKNGEGTAQKKKQLQTFLDFGQSSSIGKSCPACGMLYNDVEEDTKLHRRFCAAARQQEGKTKEEENKSLSGRDLYRYCAAVFTDPPRLKRQTAAAKAHAHYPHPSLPGVVGYLLECGGQGVTSKSTVESLLRGLGFFNALLSVAEYRVVLVVHEPSHTVLAAVAGRPSTREQDPEVVRTGANAYYHRQVFTLCDVDYLWVVPLTAVQTATAPLHTNDRRSFFHPTEAIRSRVAAQQQAAQAQVQSGVQYALEILCAHLLYGQCLSPTLHLSYAQSLFAGESEAGGWAGASLRRLLSGVLQDGKRGEVTFYEHEERENDSDDGMDNLSVVSYE